eukprot:XP_008187054.1 PREDICTED: cGMP-dependent protein kinase, isozyme 1 [Acyrthosiphon pisum]
MCHALLLFMGNAISGGGGVRRKTTESTRSAVSDLKMTTTTTAAMSELARDVERLKAAMDEKDRTIEQLGRAVEDIRNILENAVSNQFLVPSPQSPQHRLDKKKGVSGECSTATETPIPFPKQSKPIKTKHLIKQALCKNQFLKNLNTNQISEIVDVMYTKDFEAGSYVIRKGDPGCCLYVADEGKLDVIQSGRVVDSIGPGDVFGEMAILYNCPRTASVRAVQDVKVWTLERVAYQQIMKTSAMRRFDERKTSRAYRDAG